MLHKLSKLSRKSTQQWLVSLMRRSVESMIKLEIQMLSKRESLTLVEDAEVVIIMQASAMLTLEMSSCHQKISSISCSLARNPHAEVVKDNRPIITNNVGSIKLKTKMKVNCYCVSLAHC